MADLYALAIQTDRVRFGSITFLAAGERIRLKGDYEFNGKKIWQFDDSQQLGASGDKGCSHESILENSLITISTESGDGRPPGAHYRRPKMTSRPSPRLGSTLPEGG